MFELEVARLLQLPRLGADRPGGSVDSQSRGGTAGAGSMRLVWRHSPKCAHRLFANPLVWAVRRLSEVDQRAGIGLNARVG